MKNKKVKTTFQTSSSVMAPPGPTHPCNYDSNANKISVSAQSILQANVRARMVEQDSHRLYKETGQWTFDEANIRIRERYRKEFVDAGFATHKKSPDTVV